MKAKYLVCYDIVDPVRLAKVFRLMKGAGLHLQYSVFLCSFTWPELKEMKERLGTLIDHGADDVRIYPLPSGLQTYVLGQGARVPEGVELITPDRPNLTNAV